MKREYVRPTAVAEIFATNEFCANPACGKRDGKYIFTCDAPAGNVHIKYNGQDFNLGGYHPCAKQHETDGPGEYFDGWVDYNYNGGQDTNEPNALIWVEGFSSWQGWISGTHVNADNYHASASLTRESIEVERS